MFGQQATAHWIANLFIRNFTPADYPRCVHIVDAVWHFDERFKPAGLADFFKQTYVGGSLSVSNFAVVIEDNGQVQGFLFGRCGRQPLFKNEYSGTRGYLKAVAQLLLIRQVRLKTKFHYLTLIAEHERHRLQLESRVNEVHLFAVAPSAQGHGYGQRLLDAFISHCQQHQVNRITLETDQSCNLGFYDRLGFKKIAQFQSRLQQAYSGGSGDCTVLELMLR